MTGTQGYDGLFVLFDPSAPFSSDVTHVECRRL